MLEKLAKQTAIYGISTIVVRFLSYLLTPIYTRIFGQEAYGIVTDVYALIPFALVLLTMGMESGYFRFAAKAEAAGHYSAYITSGNVGHEGGDLYVRETLKTINSMFDGEDVFVKK